MKKVDLFNKVCEEAIKNNEGMLCPSNLKFSNVWATLQIPIDSLSEENRNKILKAIRLLNEAGIEFDTGMGFGMIDIELDWSLKGAVLRKHDIYCMGCRKKFKKFVMVRFSVDDEIRDYPYCSEECFWKSVNENIRKYDAPCNNIPYRDKPPIYKLIKVFCDIK